MDEKWLGIYEKLVNIDTGYEIEVEKKLESTSFLVDILKDMGFEVRRGEASHIAVKGRPPYITMIGHLDTVFRAGEPERRPFEIDGNVVRGPGVADMKGGVVIMLMVLEEISRSYKNVGVGVVLNVDEELGSPLGSKDHVDMAENSRFCLSFETGGGNWKVVTKRKGIASLKIRVFGKSGHASNPDSGANAVVELSGKVPLLVSTNFGELTLVPTIIEGGSKSNVIPDSAWLYCDVRFSSFEELDHLKKMVDDILKDRSVRGTSSSYELEIRRLPMDEIEESLKILEGASKRLGEEIETVHTGGGGDASYYTSKGVPAIDGLGIVGRGIHSEDEEAFLDSVEPRFRLAMALFEEIVGRG